VLNPQSFHDVVSGRRRDWRATSMRLALRMLEPAYGLAVRARNFTFDAGFRPIHRAQVPVISIGNITAGGTGKTPFVAWTARWLRDQAQRVAILSRGYGAKGGRPNDEGLELEMHLPGIPHLQNPNRVAAARQAIESFQCQIILLDDGFQHRRLHRNLDIVLVDALNPFGFEHLLPRGLLREPLQALRRADVVGLSRGNLVDSSRKQELWSRLSHYAPQATRIQVDFVPHGLRSHEGDSQPLENLQGMQVLAFCGIGNPQAFWRTLRACGFQVIDERTFPDHHPYDAADLASLEVWANAHPEARGLLCTDKDMVKLAVNRVGRLPLWSLQIAAEVSDGRAEFEQRLRSTLSAE